MSARSCADLAELRSAYVDGALADADRERLLTHLVHCVDCRRDVAELRQVRRLLTSTDPGLTPVDLSHRLVSIAGEEAHEPLWARPFRRTESGALPSRRRAVRARLASGMLACGLAVLTVVGVGYLASPTENTTVALEPASQAVSEFTMVVSQFPLDGRVSAALRGQRPVTAYGSRSPTWLSLPAKKLSEEKAAALLAEAGRAGDERTYSGTQVVTVSRDGDLLTNTLQVRSQAGAGTDLRPDGSRTQDASTYVEADSSTRMADADLIDELAQRYTLRGWRSQVLGARTATVVEAVEPTADPAPGALDGVAARWWVDTATGLLLGQEVYDGRGGLEISSRLVDLQLDVVLDEPTGGGTGVAARTTTTLTPSRAGDLERDGWICATELAGLPLVRLRTDQISNPGLVQLVYSDGLTTVSVVEQRGRLGDPPADSTWNKTLGSWVNHGMPSAATWSSGDVVLTVVTDGPRETLAAAVATLPHQVASTPTTMERVRAGWSRILGR